MTRLLPLLVLGVISVTAVVMPRGDDDPGRYTICGADRGYTEKDSLEAAKYLEETIVTSDAFRMEADDCIFSRVNTTVVSLCNGSARNRTINRAEVRRGINQMIQDCGLEGGFTGVHVVNNLTFASYGIYGGINIAPPSGSNPPDTPGGGNKSPRAPAHRLAKRDCQIQFDGMSHFNCTSKNPLSSDGLCQPLLVADNCEKFCEVRRTGLLGAETRPPGMSGSQQSASIKVTFQAGTEISVTNGFSIGVDGAFKGIISAGLGYEHSTTKTTSNVTGIESDEMADPALGFLARWVFFSKMYESCGTLSRSEIIYDNVPCPEEPCPLKPSSCSDVVESRGNVCIMTPKLDPAGELEVFWAIRWEYQNGTAVPLKDQSNSYRGLCNMADPNHDRQDLCLTPIPA